MLNVVTQMMHHGKEFPDAVALMSFREQLGVQTLILHVII